MTELSFTVNAKGTVQLDPLPQEAAAAPRAPRPLVDRRLEKQDAQRRPQAAVLFRALKAAGESGLSWRECWALSDDEEFVVGPIVIWMRAHGVEVEARYDSGAGETRFYLIVE
jgi:hypothetical protein